MPTLHNVAKIAELALQEIGAYTVNMTSASPEELIRAVEWIDLTVSHYTAHSRHHWLVPATVTKTLTAATASYTLSTLLGVDYPTDGIIFPIRAYIRDPSGLDTEAQIITRKEYEDLEDKDTTGTPYYIYIDRLSSSQQIYVYPVPTVSTYSLRLVFQRYSPDLSGGTPTGAGNIAHGMPSEWQLWLIKEVAYQLGSGPIRRLPMQERQILKAEADRLYGVLEAYMNSEKANSPRHVKGMF